jgi:hypothetical protein
MTQRQFHNCRHTNLSDDLVVFQNTPACKRWSATLSVKLSRGRGHTDINTVVVPVTAGHALVDIGVDTRHDGQESEGVARGGADDLERGFGEWR